MTHPTDIAHESETEQYDEIPWSHLMEDLGRPGPSLPMVATVVLILGAVVGFIVATMLDNSPSTEPVQIIATTATPVSTGPPMSPTTSPVETATPASTPPGVVFAEADLMAVATDHEVRGAAARAEWFVRDFFTVDGSSDTSSQVTRLLDGVGIVTERLATTYVEWARALVVEPLGPGRYDVVVVFRLLAADGDGFVRQPARAVSLAVDIDADLGSRVSGLPRPAAMPEAELESPVIVDQTPPAGVIAQATATASQFGANPGLLRSWLHGGTWHIVMSVEYAGAAWPLLIDVPESGSLP